MAGRNSRGKQFRGRDRKLYQWFGFQVADVRVDSSAIDNFILVPPTSDVQEQASGTLITTHLFFSWGSVVATRTTNEAIMACLQKTEFSSLVAPANVIDPTTLDAFELGNGDVLGWWQLNVPIQTSPTGVDAVNANTREVSKAKRKLDLRRHGIGCSLSGNSAIDSRITFLARCLMQYGINTQS